MNSGLTSHQQRGHTETGPRFKVSSERPEKRGIDLATPGLELACYSLHHRRSFAILSPVDSPDSHRFTCPKLITKIAIPDDQRDVTVVSDI